MSKYILNVTQEHIDNGVPAEGAYCPIANAIKDSELPFASKWFYVDGDKIAYTRINKNGYGEYTEIVLPSEAQKFINKFDNEEDVEPISFPIEY